MEKKTSKRPEKEMSRTEFAQEYNLDTNKTNCSRADKTPRTSKPNKSTKTNWHKKAIRFYLMAFYL